MNDAKAGPGDPYPFEGKKNPYLDVLGKWGASQSSLNKNVTEVNEKFMEAFTAGTSSGGAADKEGWVVSITPSGGGVPACIAGTTGVGMSQRMQSFVLDAKENPFKVY